MGVWIEIYPKLATQIIRCFVTPCVGVWIEIVGDLINPAKSIVTPCVGVWIEIGKAYWRITGGGGHSLRGSVD